ncbi:MAG: hypothetical protein WED34_01145 [Planctomycetales bacterium]
MRWHAPFRYAWASPATLIGLSLVPIVWLQGGSVRVVGGVVEVHGGIVASLLRRGFPWIGAGAAALTLGHVVWGLDAECLARSREHERVHVRQYERWGPFFIPAYLLDSLILRLRGFDPYLDNRFEREAFAETDTAT